ncbi:MAG: NAD(P)H-hydrate dehydratase [Gammaproteobacteria bacterium]|nr:NAD(P)H-hydrate dehydratase [Gammaproteobacteria bacterium]
MQRPLPDNDRLPHALYRSAQVREFDRIAIEEYAIPGRILMERAGEAAFARLRANWPVANAITLLCGIGNNGGDGYVVARLAQQAGMAPRVLQLGDESRLAGDALACARAYREAGGDVQPYRELPAGIDVIVDGVFGTGLEREVSGAWRTAIEAVNRHPAPVLALDIPSGVHADSGAVLGTAVRAEVTVSFIALKQGLFTGQGPSFCGRVHFAGLEVPARLYASQIASSRRIDWRQQADFLAPRARSAHKGDFGHLLVVGGAPGYAGAARLAAEAGARSGAGLVSLATHPAHAATLNLGRPELMVHAVASPRDLNSLLRKADVVAIGPGLGQGQWSRSLYARVLDTALPLVVDADALNLLAAEPGARENWILTPHPGEAARLLAGSSAGVERDRFAALLDLQRNYGGVVVLKGAGTLIAGPDARPPALCSEGNPGMASGGMGDLLTGILGALLAQGLELSEAAEMGVALHAAAADRAAREGERGLLASDLMPWIRKLVNGHVD